MFSKTSQSLFLKIAAIALFVASFNLQAESQQQRNWWSAGFFLDNDLFAGQDDGYTNGIRLSFVSPDLDNFVDDKRLPGWLRSVNKRIRLLRPESNQETDALNMLVTAGQQMYTPDERFINSTELIEQDRPYAGWLYLGFGYQLRNDTRLETAILNLGVIGPASYAKQSQDLVHELRGFETFQGWDNQLNNELGVQLLYGQKRKAYQSNVRHGGLSTDLITYWGGSLGNVATYLDTGLEWRFGWGLPNDFGTSSANPGGDSSSPGSTHDTRIKNKVFGSIHAYVALNGKWVLRDITLDGNTFSDSHSIDKEPLIGSVSAGVVMTTGKWQLGLSRIYLSKQFEGQPDSRGYGSVSLSYTYSFK